jgi:hypothetical protein
MSVNITIGGELAFPSKYIGAADLKGRDVTLTIARVNFDMLQLKGGKKEKKIVISFHKTDKLMVCNKTNGITIAGMHGPKMELWAGKRITLYPTTTRCGRDVVDCIRVREEAPPVPHPSADNLTIDPSTSNEAPEPDVDGAQADPPADALPPVEEVDIFNAFMLDQGDADAAALERIALHHPINAPGKKGVDARYKVARAALAGKLDWESGKVKD